MKKAFEPVKLRENSKKRVLRDLIKYNERNMEYEKIMENKGFSADTKSSTELKPPKKKKNTIIMEVLAGAAVIGMITGVIIFSIKTNGSQAGKPAAGSIVSDEEAETTVYQGALAVESSEPDYINDKEKITTIPSDSEPVSEPLSEQVTEPLEEEPVSEPLSEQVTEPLEEIPYEIDNDDNNDYYTLSLEAVSSDNGLISVGDKYCTIHGRSGSLHETTDKTDTTYDDFVFNYDYIIYVPMDQIYDINNNPVGKGILEKTENMPSLSITVYYDGMVLESYPAQIYADKVIINNLICD